ncbi:hypothetical protein EHP00_1031 [Ecytonucleospora hepatopenaei]|uniref:Mediator complex subunit 15 KIX domain-containing protein n=1 Tax=Ecytonucleospora hepatopenaei TaxID=646526 RepID=A0A1W0E517_9MICR|nr:hypothetical protein EHP00_1031 [Ecytonucleospora hepatopenaei]
MHVPTDFRKRMVIELIEALKDHPTFSNIQFTLIKEAVLNSEQQIYLSTKNKHEYAIAINKKIEQIKSSSISISNESNSTDISRNSIENKAKNFYVKPQNMLRRQKEKLENRSEQYITKPKNKIAYMDPSTTELYTDKSINEKKFSKIKLQKNEKFSFLNDFENFFETKSVGIPKNLSKNNKYISKAESSVCMNGEIKKRKMDIHLNNSRKNTEKLNENTENKYCKVFDIVNDTIPTNVNFTININKKTNLPDHEPTSLKNVKNKANTIQEEKDIFIEKNENNEFEKFISEFNIVELQIDNEEEWTEALDFLIDLGEKDEKVLMQHKNRHFKFLSKDAINEKISWYTNNVDFFIEEATKAYKKHYNVY